VTDTRPGNPGPPRVEQPVPRAHWGDPYPYYAELRRRAPVVESAGGLFVVVGHEAAHSALRDPRAIREDERVPGFRPRGGDWLADLAAAAADAAGREGLIGLSRSWMLNLDPPRHPPLRRAAQRSFAGATIEARRAEVARLAREMLDRLDGRREFDLMAELARPLPARVVCDLVGVPAGERGEILEAARSLGPAVAGEATGPEVDRAATATVELARRFRDLVAGGAPAGSFAAELGVAVAAGDLDEPTAVAQCLLLLFAGQETSANLIGNGVAALLGAGDSWAVLAAHPEGLSRALEELLRFDGPVQFTFRRARAAIDLGGVPIPAGARLAVGLGAANRDPARFADPDRLDLGREPNPHLAFGAGIHNCLGAGLARLEAGEALRALLERRPGLALAGPADDLQPGAILRGRRSLRVSD
jgi:cytochrome P450